MWSSHFPLFAACRTTQAQRPGTRDAWIADLGVMPGYRGENRLCIRQFYLVVHMAVGLVSNMGRLVRLSKPEISSLLLRQLLTAGRRMLRYTTSGTFIPGPRSPSLSRGFPGSLDSLFSLACEDRPVRSPDSPGDPGRTQNLKIGPCTEKLCGAKAYSDTAGPQR